MRLAVVLLALLGAACAGPRSGAPWVAEFQGSPERGAQRVVLLLDANADAPLSGGSRRGATSAITGRALVAAWEHVAPRGGSLVEIERAGVPRAGAPLAVELDTPIGRVLCEGVWTEERFAGAWTALEPAARPPGGTFVWTPRAVADAERPLEDYPALLDAFAAELERRFVFPARLDDAWRAELADARARAAHLVDDFEFVGLVARLCAELAPGTLCLRGARVPALELAAEVDGDVAILRLGAVAGAVAEIDRALDRAVAEGARALVVDLRGAVGFDLTAARLASWLVRERAPAGYVLGRTRADGGALTADERDRLPVVYGTYDLALYRAAVALTGAAAGGVAPRSEGGFGGPVAILIDGETRGSVEPVVELLQRQGRALVVGAPSAGASVDVELVPLPGGWTALIPVATWVTWGGRWMERDPVVPDVACDPLEALDVALARIRSSF